MLSRRTGTSPGATRRRGDQLSFSTDRIRRRRAFAGAVVAAACVTAGGLRVAATDGTLPGGTPISVDITSVADGAVVAYGTPITLSGTAAIGTNSPTPNVRLIYDLDVSGSTGSSAGACGDMNSDGIGNTVLDCEIGALVNLNTVAIGKGSIQDVGVVALGGHQNGTVGGPGDSVVGDVGPAAGVQTLTTADGDVNNNAKKDVVETLVSARNGTPGVSGSAAAGLQLFTPLTVTNPFTNFQQSVIVATQLANSAPSVGAKVVVLVSDGQANSGSTGLPGADALGRFPTIAAFQNWVATTAAGVRFITFAVGSSATCLGPTTNTFGSLQAIAAATGGTCTNVLNPAQLPDVLPQLVEPQLTSVVATVDGAPTAVTVSAALPLTGPGDVTWSAAGGPLTLAPGLHELCARAFGSDSGGTDFVEECVTVEVVAVDAGSAYGGDPNSSFEGTPIAITATTNGGAVFDQWSYTAGPDVDAGATCSFASPTSASTTVTCTDDGSYVLTAHSIGPVDASDADLVLYNAAPEITGVSAVPSGTVLTGSAVTVSADFTDAGANDTHTCSVDWGGSIGVVAGSMSETNGVGTCSDTRNLPAAGAYAIAVTVTDDDAGSDTDATSAGTITVEDLVISSGGGSGGGYVGVEGAAVNPSASAPAGTTFAWSVTTVTADPGTSCVVTDASTATPSITCDDDGDFAIHLVATLQSQSVEATASLVVDNADPTIDSLIASPATTVFVGSPVTLSAAFSDDGANDTHTCSVDWGGAIGAVSVAPTESGGTGTCEDSQTPAPGSYTVAVTVTDDDGGAATASVDVTVVSVQINPGAGEGGAYVGVEGAPVAPTAITPSGATLLWSAAPVSADPGASCSVVDATTETPAITCTDDGTFEITVSVTVGGNTQIATAPLLLDNAAPTVSEPSVAPSLVAIGAPVTTSSVIDDDGSNDSHTCSWTWGDGSSTAGSVAADGTCTGTHSYGAAGIYLVTVDVADDDGATASASYRYVVVYDPSAGFVTGGGTIDVQAGSYVADPTLRGKANFGFVSKYKKGATVPSGNTEFQFHAAGMNFSSSAYDWLVVSGAKAQFKGTGTLNGTAGYGFLVTITDGAVRGGGGTDQFRIKIWDVASGAIVFDNVLGGSDDLSAPALQAISSGSIVIHASK